MEHIWNGILAALGALFVTLTIRALYRRQRARRLRRQLESITSGHHNVSFGDVLPDPRIRDDVPLAAKMNLMPWHVTKLVDRLTGATTRFVKTE